jgi:hypothetical protein
VPGAEQDFFLYQSRLVPHNCVKADLAHLLLKIVIGAIGVLAIYVGCFLYEDEEGKLQNRVEELSQSLKARRDSGESLPLVSTVAGFINHLLDRILGKRLFSLRMAGVSSCFSLSTLFGFTAFVLHVFFPEEGEGVAALFASVCFIVAMLASKYPSRWTTALCLLPPLFIFIYTPLTNFILIFQPTLTIVLLLVSLLSDIFVVLVIRVTLRTLLRRPTALLFVAALIGQLAIILLLLIVPTYALDNLHSLPEGLSNYGSAICGMNISSGMVSLAFICVLLFFLLHRIFWPIASRIIYPIARFKILQNRKFMVGAGAICLAVISPPFAALLEKVAKLFH